MMLRLKKNRKTIIIAVLSYCIFFISGCSVVQLENRSFPMAIGIDKLDTGEKLLLSFDFPDLKEASGGKKEDKTPAAVTIEAEKFYQAQKAYETNTNRVIDYNHLKALVFGKDFLKDSNKIRELFRWFEYQEILARNTCLFIAEKEAKEILSLAEGTQGSVGKFLEQMIQSHPDFKKGKVMTIGKLMNQWHNQNETILIPILTNNGGIPVVNSYAVIKRFEFVETISVQDAMRTLLSQNQVKRLEYELEDSTVIEIQNINRNIQIDKDQENATVKIKITGKGLPKNLTNLLPKELEQLKYNVDKQLSKSLNETANKMLNDKKIDISNSFILLGGYNRKLYDYYRENPNNYEKNLNITYEVSITMLNY